MNLLDAIDDPQLFGPWFRDRATWLSWFAFIAAVFALPMDEDQAAVFRRCTGRKELPSTASKEAWLVIGRRGGKSFILALIAVFLACFYDYRQHLAPGERGTVLVIAADRRQSRVILRYVRGLLTGVPMLARLIERETAESFDLTNRVTIEIAAGNFRTVRGYTLVAALCDEIAFWRSDDSANPDREILDALRPAQATIPNAMLLCASSPYARRGELWRAYQEHYGKDGAPLVWQADTRTMNPSVPQSFIDEEMQRDPASAAAEYGAQFRTDVESYIPLEAVRACIEPGVRERLPLRQWRYVAFTDPSGGSSDSMTLAVAHKEGDTAILDLLREVRPPFSPEAVVEEFADVLRRYRLTKVYGDRYAGEWCREVFSRHGLNYEIAEKPKSDLYRDLLPLINSRGADLLENERLVAAAGAAGAAHGARRAGQHRSSERRS